MTPPPPGQYTGFSRQESGRLSRTLSGGLLRPLSGEESGEEPDREFRSLCAKQQGMQLAGLQSGFFSTESGRLWPEQQSRQQSGLRAGQSPDLPAGLFPVQSCSPARQRGWIDCRVCRETCWFRE